jgi:homoserine kinase type II
MSVYTTISQPDLEDFLGRYTAGRLVSYCGIQSGITNTNYFVDTDTGRYVLTIVEHETAEDVEWFMQLLSFLNSARLPCAEPMLAGNGDYTTLLYGKPATLVRCLAGKEKTEVGSHECSLLGEMLAKMHIACRDYQPLRTDSRGPDWRERTAQQVMPKLNSDERALLQNAMATGALDQLPRSIIHADLFRDNVLFEDNTIGGIIDFYYACDGCMLYDLAIVYNDWCRDDTGNVIEGNATALLDSYQALRPFENNEKAAWYDAVKTAALRFWLSRLQDMHFPQEGSLTFIKDPDTYLRILRQY